MFEIVSIAGIGIFGLAVIILRFASFSAERRIFLASGGKYGKQRFNLNTMSLPEGEMTKLPENLQEDFRKKKKVDRYFFICFAILFLFIALKVLNI
jgi:hypothetical protein